MGSVFTRHWDYAYDRHIYGHQFAEFVAASRKLEIGYAVITGAASRVRYS